MKKSKKAVNCIKYGLIFLISFVIFLNFKPYTANAEQYKGNCGATKKDNVKWLLDTDTHTLSISGTGTIKDYHQKEAVDPGDNEYDIPEITEDWHLYRTKIYTIEIGDGITCIGAYAFCGASNLETVSLPDTLTSIKDYAFKNCPCLDDVSIPSSVEYIGERAFGDCSGLSSIIIPEGVSILDTGAFKDCSSLASVELPSTLKTIGDHAFYGCESLTDVNIPEGVTKVLEHAFKNCTGLKTVHIPYGVTDLPPYLFEGCKKLKEVTVPVTINTITTSTFKGCPDVVITGINTYTKNYAKQNNITFKNSGSKYNGLIYTIHNNEVIIAGYYENIFSLDIPEQINNCKVTSIWDKTFKDEYNLTELTLPETIRYIGDSAFEGCFDLIQVTNYSSLKIEYGSDKNGFAGCYAKNIRTSDNDSKICISSENDYLFAGFDNNNYLIGYTGNEKSITLPDSFKNSSGKSVKSYHIYMYAFAGCTTLTNVNVSSSVGYIMNSAFCQCKNLSGIYIPSNVSKIIGNNVFSGCKKNLTIECFENTKAHEYAKSNKINYKLLTAPKVPTSIVDSMVSLEYNFIEWNRKGCKPKVTVKSGNTVLKEKKDYTLKYTNSKNVGTATVTVTGKGNYTNSVKKEYKIKLLVNHSYKTDDYELRITKLNNDGKSGTVALKKYIGPPSKKVNIGDSINIGNGLFKVTEIGKELFSKNMDVNSVTIGKYVTKINTRAFYGCKKLKSITIKSEVLKFVGNVAVKNINKKAVIYVPSSKKSAYIKLFTNKTGFYKPMKIKAF